MLRCSGGPRQYAYVGFSLHKVPHTSSYTIPEKAIRFHHSDYNLDRAQKLISLSMSRHLSTRNISSKSMHTFLSNLANRQTDKHGQKHLPPPLSEVIKCRCCYHWCWLHVYVASVTVVTKEFLMRRMPLYKFVLTDWLTAWTAGHLWQKWPVYVLLKMFWYMVYLECVVSTPPKMFLWVPEVLFIWTYLKGWVWCQTGHPDVCCCLLDPLWSCWLFMLKWLYLRTSSSTVACHHTLVRLSVWLTYQVAKLSAPPTSAASSSHSPTVPPLATRAFPVAGSRSGIVWYRRSQSHQRHPWTRSAGVCRHMFTVSCMFRHTTIVTDQLLLVDLAVNLYLGQLKKYWLVGWWMDGLIDWLIDWLSRHGVCNNICLFVTLIVTGKIVKITVISALGVYNTGTYLLIVTAIIMKLWE